MSNLDPLARYTYLTMEAAILGSLLVFVLAFHFPILWRQRRALALVTVIVTVYGAALDAWAIQNGWGWFNPALTSGVWLASGLHSSTLLLEELIFWIGTAFITAALALVMAEGVERGIAWWALLVTLAYPSWWWLKNDETMFGGVRE